MHVGRGRQQRTAVCPTSACLARSVHLCTSVPPPLSPFLCAFVGVCVSTAFATNAAWRQGQERTAACRPLPVRLVLSISVRLSLSPPAFVAVCVSASVCLSVSCSPTFELDASAAAQHHQKVELGTLACLCPRLVRCLLLKLAQNESRISLNKIITKRYILGDCTSNISRSSMSIATASGTCLRSSLPAMDGLQLSWHQKSGCAFQQVVSEQLQQQSTSSLRRVPSPWRAACRAAVEDVGRTST